MNVNLPIERLILHGVDMVFSQRHLLYAGLQTEIARLLTEGGLASRFSSCGTLPQMASLAIQLNSGQGVTELVRQVASAVFGEDGK